LNSPRVSVVVLNWNGWRDTVECLESLCRLDYPDYRVIVVDNGSSDESVKRIQAWADGSEPLTVDAPPELRYLTSPPTPKPLSVRNITWDGQGEVPNPTVPEPTLTVIETGANLGYAGGNNIGIRYALADGVDYIWILNNDTVVESRALQCLVGRAETDEKVGLCGSTLLEYSRPHLIQAAGGAHYDYRTSRHKIAGRGLTAVRRPSAQEVETSISYVSGASVMVRNRYVRDVGLMEERYFLYFEELDWALRGRPLGYLLGYAGDAFIYHKEGASTGLKGSKTLKAFAQYYFSRSLLLMTGRFYKAWLLVIFMKVIGTSLKRLLTGHLALASAIVLAILRPELGAHPDDLRQRFDRAS
jgi:GT2 family glycosyltransferase